MSNREISNLFYKSKYGLYLFPTIYNNNAQDYHLTLQNEYLEHSIYEIKKHINKLNSKCDFSPNIKPPNFNPPDNSTPNFNQIKNKYYVGVGKIMIELFPSTKKNERIMRIYITSGDN